MAIPMTPTIVPPTGGAPLLLFPPSTRGRVRRRGGRRILPPLRRRPRALLFLGGGGGGGGRLLRRRGGRGRFSLFPLEEEEEEGFSSFREEDCFSCSERTPPQQRVQTLPSSGPWYEQGASTPLQKQQLPPMGEEHPAETLLHTLRDIIHT